MQSDTQIAPTSKTMLWTGRIISALTVLMLLTGGVMKLVNPDPDGSKEMLDKIGWDEGMMPGLAIVEITFTLLYLIPQTAALGAILLTGYLGGAVATHARVGDAFFAPIIPAVLAWLGLYLRDARLRALLPLRGDPLAPASGCCGNLSLLKKIALVVVTVALMLVITVALQPSKYHIARSATIAAAPAEVFAQVNDFHNWDAWSPWVKIDPKAKVSFEGPQSGKGAIFRWDGNAEIGQGSMTLTESRPSELIRIRLDFVKPMEDSADTEFTFKPKGEQTVVTWSMSGRRGFVGKAVCMIMNMEKMVGGKYEEGLANMKDVVEKGRTQQQ